MAALASVAQHDVHVSLALARVTLVQGPRCVMWKLPRGPRHYILDEEHQIVPIAVDLDAPNGTEELLRWALWLEDPAHRRVAWTDIGHGAYVSTIFLGIDHNWAAHGPPILFETMVFVPTDIGTDPLHHHQDRYCTWDDAVAGHWRIVEWVRGELAKASGT